MSYKIVMSKAQLQVIVKGLSQLPSDMVADEEEGQTVGQLKELFESTIDFPEGNTVHGFIL